MKSFLIRIPNYICPGNIASSLNFIKTMSKSTFYHAGCPVCVSAEQDILNLIEPGKVDVVHLGEDKTKISDAETLGVQSVPALVTPSGNVLHINYGAGIEDLKN